MNNLFSIIYTQGRLKTLINKFYISWAQLYHIIIIRSYSNASIYCNNPEHI